MKMEANQSLLGDSNVTSFVSTLEVFPIRPWILFSYCLISVTGIIGNTFVIVIISRHENMKATSFRIYISALAIVGVLVSLLCIPIYITSTSNFHYHPTGISGTIMCKILSGYMIPFHLSRISIYIMVAISIQRYFAICKPLSTMAHPYAKKAKIIVCGICFATMFLAIYRITSLEYTGEGAATVGAHCKLSTVFSDDITPKVIYMLTTIFEFIVPVCIMVFCFYQFKTNIAKQISQINLEEESTREMMLKRIHSRKQTFVTVIIVVISFTALLTPNQILYFCFNFNIYQTSWNSNLYQSTVVLYFFTSCINPFIYSFRSKPFRDRISEIRGYLLSYYRELRNRSQSGISVTTTSSVINPL